MIQRASKRQSPASRTSAEETRSPVGRYLIAGGAALSTLTLLFVYFQPPLERQVPDESPASTTGVPAEPSVVASAPAKLPDATSNRQLSGLPQSAVDFDTKSEQQRLLSSVQQALVDFPENAEIFHIAAVTYAELLQTERASELFQKSLDLDGRQAEVVVAYADVLLQVGKQQQAVKVLEDARNRGIQTAGLFTALGEAYSQLGELEQAADILLQGVDSFPEDGNLRVRLAQAQVQLSQFAEAEKQARLAMDLGQADRAVYIALTTALTRLGRREEALELRRQMPAVPDRVMPSDDVYHESFRHFASHNYSLLASVGMAQNSFDQAEEWLKRALELEPTSAQALTTLADLCYRTGRTLDALEVQQRMIEVQPSNLLNYSNYASLAVSLGKVALAETALRRRAEVDDSGQSNLMLAQFLLGLGKAPEAVVQAKFAVERLANVDAYLVWIYALRAHGETAAALNALLKARQIAPGDPRLADIQL